MILNPVFKNAMEELASGALTMTDYQNVIMSSDYQENITGWLRGLKAEYVDEKCDLTTQMLAVIPLFVYRLEEMVDDPKRKPHQKIYQQALSVIDTLENNDDTRKVLQSFHNFSRHFRVWKKCDRFRVVEEYAKLYWELEVEKMVREGSKSQGGEMVDGEIGQGETGDGEPVKGLSPEELQTLNERQEKIKSTIMETAGYDGLTQLEQYTPIIMDQSAVSSLQQEVTETLQRAYWTNFQHTMENGDWSYFDKLLEEIKHRFQALVPKHPEVQEELETRLSNARVGETGEGPSVDKAQELANYMIEMIEHFQAPAADKDRELFWDQLQHTVPYGGNLKLRVVTKDNKDKTEKGSEETGQGDSWRANFFTHLFQWVMSRQDIIFSQISKYQQTSSLMKE